jgi:fucose permease
MGQGIVSIMSERFGPNRSIGITEANIFGSLFAFAAPLMVGQFIDGGLTWRGALIVPLVIFAALWINARQTFSKFSVAATQGFANAVLPMRYWFFWFVIWFSVASEWSIIYWTSEFLEKAKGLDRADAIRCISIFMVTMLIGRVIGLKLARSFNLGPLLSVVSVVALVGFLVYWLGPTPPVSLVGLAVTGIGMSNIYPLSFSQAIGSAENNAGLAAGRMSISTGTAVLTTPLLMGAIGDRFGIQSSYAVIAVLMTLAMILLAIAAFRKKAKE